MPRAGGFKAFGLFQLEQGLQQVRSDMALNEFLQAVAHLFSGRTLQNIFGKHLGLRAQGIVAGPQAAHGMA